MGRKKKGSESSCKYREHAGGVNPNDWRIQIHEKPKRDEKLARNRTSSRRKHHQQQQQHKEKDYEKVTSISTLPILYKDIIRERDEQTTQRRKARRKSLGGSLYPNIFILILLYFGFYFYDNDQNLYNNLMTTNKKEAPNANSLVVGLNATTNATTSTNDTSLGNATTTNTTIATMVAAGIPILVKERTPFVSKAVLVDPMKLTRERASKKNQQLLQNLTTLITPDFSNMVSKVLSRSSSRRPITTTTTNNATTTIRTTTEPATTIDGGTEVVVVVSEPPKVEETGVSDATIPL